jgi:hypothetical protein
MFEEFGEGTVLTVGGRHTLPSQGRLTFAGDADVHHCRRVLLDQGAEIGNGHLDPNRRRGVGRQRRRQHAGRKYRATGRQGHRNREFFELAGNLHGRHLSRNMDFSGIETDPIPRCAPV